LNAELQAEMVDAIRQLQGETAGTVTLAGVDYPCTASSMVTGRLDLVQGGALAIKSVTVSVLQADLPIEPTVNSLAVFRGNNLRVLSTDDAETFWSIMLVQEDA
jgi:hypothetical protein